MPAILRTLAPLVSGRAIVQPVKLVHVCGYATPLISIVSTLTGAVPVTYATLLVIFTCVLTVKLEALTAANCEAMLLFAEVSHGSMALAGFSTFWPFWTNAAYLAFNSGLLLAAVSGPLTSSCNARQYILL